jgi:hypothetical protein
MAHDDIAQNSPGLPSWASSKFIIVATPLALLLWLLARHVRLEEAKAPPSSPKITSTLTRISHRVHLLLWSNLHSKSTFAGRHATRFLDHSKRRRASRSTSRYQTLFQSVCDGEVGATSKTRSHIQSNVLRLHASSALGPLQLSSFHPTYPIRPF